MHRSNNSSPYPLFERLFAVILSVTDIKKITFVGRIAMVATTGAFKKIDAKATESGPLTFGPLSTLFVKRQIRLSEVWINAAPL